MRRPYTLYKERVKAPKGAQPSVPGAKARFIWYVRFWDSQAGRYSVSRSTGIPVEGKRERRWEAENAARAMLPTIKFAPKSKPKCADTPFLQYVEEFWTPGSPYVKECAVVRKKPLSAYYVRMHHDDVRRHMAAFPDFKNLPLRKLTKGIIRDWMTWAAERGLSGNRINSVIEGMRVPVRYALSREELDKDPFKDLIEATEEPKEKGILTPAEVKMLISSPATDPLSRLAVLLGILCGMRRGEVRGLQWGDIKDGLIHITHNYVDGEALKIPKCDSKRKVPLPASVGITLEECRNIAFHAVRDDLYIFESFERPGQPMGETFFRNAIQRELEAIGIPGKWHRTGKKPEGYVNEQARRNITFHSLRHTFVTLGRLAGISDLEIQALAGHRDPAMMAHYSHAAQVLDFDLARQKMENVAGGTA